MKRKALLIALSVLLLSAMIAPAAAGPTDVVITVGNWFKYERKVTKWISTDPFLPEGYYGPLSLADNNTNSVVYSVTAITPVAGATNVTFSVAYNWKSGSPTTETYVESVSTANQAIFMIGANMAAGQMVSDTFDFLGMGFYQYPARYITRTFDRVTPTGTRATNECNYTIDIMGSIYNYTFWWDKATGMEVYYENSGNVLEIFTAAYQYTVVYTLVDSSIAGIAIPEYTGPVVLLMLMAITVPIILHKRKRVCI